MKKSISIKAYGFLSLLISMLVLFNANLFAQEQETGPNLNDIIEGVNVSGFVTTFYQYNLAQDGDRTDDREIPSPFAPGITSGRDELGFPNFLMFRDDNAFSLENVEIQIIKEATEEHPVGFGFVTNYGEIARNLTFGGRFPTGDHDNNDEDRVTVPVGYVQWLIPVGKGINFKIGRFATWIGSEVWEDVDNPNLTHSQNYNNSIPFTHSGLSLGYPVTDSSTVTLYVVNGWDTFTDNNDAKTFGWQWAWSPSDRVTMVFNGIHGAEKPNNNNDITHLFDWVGSFKINDKLSFLANYDIGWTEDNMIDTDGDGFRDAGADAHWSGGTLTGIWNFTDWMNLAVRYSYSDYTDEFGFSIWETTATLNIRLSDNLLIRPEYRHNDFNKDGISASGQEGDDIVAVGFSYIF